MEEDLSVLQSKLTTSSTKMERNCWRCKRCGSRQLGIGSPWKVKKCAFAGEERAILGDPGAASWGNGIFTGESLQQERESPWAFTLTERVPEALEIPLADWPEKFFWPIGRRISNSSGTRPVRVNAQGLSRSCCKLSPVKIPLPQLAAPGSPRMRNS